MNTGLDPLHVRYVEGFAAKAYRRLRAAGCASLQREDVVQECWIAWCKARDGFDPNHGSKFGSYLFGVMAHHINRWAKSHLSYAHAASVSIDGDENSSLHESLSAPDVEADQVVTAKQVKQRLVVRLSPQARATLELLESPPGWLLGEMAATRAKVAWDRERGFMNTTAPARISMLMLFSLFRFSALERKRVRAELAALCELVQ